MKAKRRTEIKRYVSILAVVAGIILITKNIQSMYGISQVNKTANVVIDEYMVSLQKLEEIETTSERIHKYALSHIVATNLVTMLDVATMIQEETHNMAEAFSSYEQYVTEESKEVYESLLSNYKVFQNSLANLLAYSVGSNKNDAYAYANNELADAASEIISNIDALKEVTQANSEAARKVLRRNYITQFGMSISFAVLSVILLTTVLNRVTKKVVNPITGMSAELKAIIDGINNREGDLTKRITIGVNNEVGDLGNGMNIFLEKLQHIFEIIRSNADKMDFLVDEVLGSVNASSDNATDLSSVTEELSATMEEVSGHTLMINQNAGEVRDDVNDIAEKSTKMDEYAKEMKKNADNMQSNARIQLEEIDSKVKDMLEVLNQAIEESQSVDKVSNLTNDILSISSQTNLLALNASIEAARAGEAGKGFAVVAEEIRNLADSSRETANNIKEINGVVTDAVHNLSDNANTLIGFMTESILPGFESFIEVGNQYKNDADYIENVMNDFADKTEELKSTMNNIAKSINTITTAIEDGVKGLNGAAESTQGLVVDMANITEQMNANKEIATELKEEAAIFKEI